MLWPDPIGNSFLECRVALHRMQVLANASIMWSSICQSNSCINQQIRMDVSALKLFCVCHRLFVVYFVFCCRAANRFQFVRHKLVGNGNIERLRQNAYTVRRHSDDNSCTDFDCPMYEYMVIIFELVHRPKSRAARPKNSTRRHQGERLEHAIVWRIGCYTAIDHKGQRNALLGMGLMQKIRDEIFCRYSLKLR